MSTFSNYYSANPLNRLSYLRQSKSFLASALVSPKAKFLIFDDKLNLLTENKSPPFSHAYSLGWDDVKSYLGDPEAVFADVEGKAPGGVPAFSAFLGEAAGLVFLGVDESSQPAQSLPENTKAFDAADASVTLESHSPYGVPYWAIDAKHEKLKPMYAAALGPRVRFLDIKIVTRGTLLNAADAGIFAEARALIDWGRRNVFCPGCAAPLKGIWAGWKRVCETADCFSHKGVHNFNYPRTDPVVIMAVVSADGERILLGRQRVWPAKFYSCLAGFIESGETIEDAVKREVYEEAGVQLERVIYHSSQPWPYPASLMIGCVGVGKADQTIRTDLDNELEAAFWVPRDVILARINKPTRQRGDGAALNDEGEELSDVSDEDTVGNATRFPSKSFFLPPDTAIARNLIQSWAEKKIPLLENSSKL